MTKEKLIYRLKQARKMKGESLRESSKGLGMSHNGLNKYERGEIKIDSEMLCKFAKYYNVSIDYLFPRQDRVEIKLENVEMHKFTSF